MSLLRGELRRHEPMSKHTSWRVGGPADIWFRPQDRDDLQAFLASHDEAVFWLGLGSNLLVRDGGIRGAAITLYDALAQMERRAGQTVYVEAGAHCARLAKFCAAQGLAGAAFFAGIPGTVGGALSMNAGAFGDETWPHVRRVDMLNDRGELVSLEAEAFDYAYRSVTAPFQGGLFLAAELEFAAGNAQQEADKVKQLLRDRRASQPVGQPSCGSVFRNPPGDHAARLIEASGLKGYAIGGACVAQKHANFILNTGEARAAEIEALIAHVADEVERQQGVRLQPEVRVVGEVLQ